MPLDKLKTIRQIDFVYLSAKDVVRHPVVAEIIRAYEDEGKASTIREKD
ncbi:PhoH family protein [Streptococcus sobrinus DSM 20742 = ATCC 33478]|nr:PhoH family protein [Streptococcus sobrinus DSM 20742 = ATCC 33478]